MSGRSLDLPTLSRRQGRERTASENAEMAPFSVRMVRWEAISGLADGGPETGCGSRRTGRAEKMTLRESVVSILHLS